MGRWSRRLAPLFLNFAGGAAGLQVLDVGCGTGSLTSCLLAEPGIKSVMATDISNIYLRTARTSLVDPRLTFRCDDASALPDADHSYDMSLSLLVLHNMLDPENAVREMRRVTRAGGTVAAAVWDVWGGLPDVRMFLDTAAMFDAAGAAMRTRFLSVPLTRGGELAQLWRDTGLVAVEQAPLSVRCDYANFDDYWSGFLTGDGTMGAYVASLAPEPCDALGQHVKNAYTAGRQDGPRSFVATAWVCRGIVPA